MYEHSRQQSLMQLVSRALEETRSLVHHDQVVPYQPQRQAPEVAQNKLVEVVAQQE